MKNLSDTSNIYASGEYIRNNPTLDVEDSPWKLRLLEPALERLLQESGSKELRILDVGGGGGLILKGVSDYLEQKKIRVVKYALDLSAEMLEIQRGHNPEIAACIRCGIEKTPFSGKEMDLVLMIDVLEHVLDPASALEELRRIANYIIFKVPFEHCLYYNILNLLKMGGLRRDIFQKVGHVQFYHPRKLKAQIRRFAGEILYFRFSNEFGNMLSTGYHRKLKMREKVVFSLANAVYAVSPLLCSRLFPDSVVCLVTCR